MNELDFQASSDPRLPQFKGPPLPLTAQMRHIAANPSHNWRTAFELARIERSNEKQEERKQRWALRGNRKKGDKREETV